MKDVWADEKDRMPPPQWFSNPLLGGDKERRLYASTSVVENDEPGIDRDVPAVHFDVVRMCVAADVVRGLENDNLVIALQPQGRCQPGNPGSDYGNFHDRFLACH